MMRIRLQKYFRRFAWLSAALTGLVLAVGVWLWQRYPFPLERLENWPVNPCVSDNAGRPYFDRVATDDQWRRPVPLADMSDWLIQATLAIEDKRFYRHGGVDGLAVLRAAGQNLSRGHIVSGASTLTMQVCRMMDNRPRNCGAKLIESFRALQLEQLKTKAEILETYLNIAPYGGNLRGVASGASAWFGKPPRHLSLAESAFLAGLPQAPARYNPARHLDRAIGRQREVLRQMHRLALIDGRQLRQALAEPIRIDPAARQEQAIHAAVMALARQPQGGRTTLDLDIQQQVQACVDDHLPGLPAGSEVAVVVIDIEQSALAALIGSGDPADPVDGQVNGVLARRSPGSALKPFIYAAALAGGRINADSIVYDIPIQRAGWSPDNFDRTFAGPVTVTHALQRSLNIPAILVAEAVGLARCCGLLEAAGIALPSDAQSRGGLALAVGGIEVSLLDLTNGYATLGRRGVRGLPRLFADDPLDTAVVLAPEVCATLDDMLGSTRRIPAGAAGLDDGGSPWFMWKTGTSSGRRDAWAVGHNRRYAIGVWVGRFRGTGRFDYVGSLAAEPLLTRLFSLPLLRTHLVPPTPASLTVARPLPQPLEWDENRLRILNPPDNGRYIALNGITAIGPQANRPDGLTWFLNGQRLTALQSTRLELTPGQYELRCVAADRHSASVDFIILPDTRVSYQ